MTMSRSAGDAFKCYPSSKAKALSMILEELTLGTMRVLPKSLPWLPIDPDPDLDLRVQL